MFLISCSGCVKGIPSIRASTGYFLEYARTSLSLAGYYMKFKAWFRRLFHPRWRALYVNTPILDGLPGIENVEVAKITVELVKRCHVPHKHPIRLVFNIGPVVHKPGVSTLEGKR